MSKPSSRPRRALLTPGQEALWDVIAALEAAGVEPCMSSIAMGCLGLRAQGVPGFAWCTLQPMKDLCAALSPATSRQLDSDLCALEKSGRLRHEFAGFVGKYACQGYDPAARPGVASAAIQAGMAVVVATVPFEDVVRNACYAEYLELGLELAASGARLTTDELLACHHLRKLADRDWLGEDAKLDEAARAQRSQWYRSVAQIVDAKLFGGTLLTDGLKLAAKEVTTKRREQYG